MLCVKKGTQVVMKGYEGSPIYQYLTLKITTCTNNSMDSFPCQTSAAISSFMSTHLSTNDFFKVSFYIVDTNISPAQVSPIQKAL